MMLNRPIATLAERKWLEMQVVERDEGKCILCGAPAMYHPHHIIPKSRAAPNSKKTWRIENMCCSCGPCHADGQKSWKRQEFLQKMVELYEYDMRWTRELGVVVEG